MLLILKGSRNQECDIKGLTTHSQSNIYVIFIILSLGWDSVSEKLLIGWLIMPRKENSLFMTGDVWTELLMVHLMVWLWSSGRTRSKNTEFEASHQQKKTIIGLTLAQNSVLTFYLESWNK